MVFLVNILICIACFIFGALILPIATDKLLRYKYSCMDKSWYLRLEDAKNKSSNCKNSSWLDSQVRACKCGRLNKTRVQALYECGAINTIDNLSSLKSKKQEAISYTFSPNLIQRACCGFSCVALAAIAVFLMCSVQFPTDTGGVYEIGVTDFNGLRYGVSDAHYSSSLVISLMCVIGTLLTCVCICDLRARIIPYQLCALYAFISVVWVLVTRSVSDIPISLYIAIASALGVCIIERCALRITGASAIGAGDRRIIPIIAFQVGLNGMFAGLLAMSATGLVMAVFTLAQGGTRKSYLPFAPPLYAWALAGSVASVLAL